METANTPSSSDGFVSDNTASVQTLNSAFGDDSGSDILNSISEQLLGETKEEAPVEEVKEEEEESDELESIDEGDDEEVLEEVEETQAEDNRVKYKATVDGEETDLPDDAIIKIKVDGKDTEVELAELVKDYNGKVVWEKRFEEVAKEKKAIASERLDLETDKTQFVNKAKTVDTKLNEIFQLSQSNPIQCVMELCKLAGMNTKEAMANYIIQANKVVNEWGEMDIGSRQALLDRIELEQRRSELDKIEKEKTETVARTQVQSKLTNLITSRGVDITEFRAAANYIMQNRPEILENAQTEEEITEKVLDTMSALETYNSTESVVMKVAPQRYGKLSQSDKRDLINDLVKLRIDGATDKDIARTIREVFGVTAKKISTTTLESPKSVQPKASATTRTTPKKSETKQNVPNDIDKILADVMKSGF